MPIKVRQGGNWIDVTGDSDTTYTLPLTGANGASGVGSAKWTLDASSGTDTSVTLNPGSNISISSIDTSGDDRAFTLDAIDTKYDYVLVDHGSSTGSGTGNDSILRLDGATASGNTDDDIRLIAGANIALTPNTSAGTITIAATPGGVTTFLGLTDTPGSYSGQGGKLVKVNSTPDGLEFADETTYLLKCTKDADGGSTGTDADPYLFLDSSSGTDDSIQIVGSGGITVTRNDDSQFTISGSNTTGTTYQLPVFGTGNGSSGLRLTGSDSSTDDVNVTGSGGITVIGSGTDTLTVDGSAITGTTYDYLLVDHGSSTGAGSGNDSVLRLDPSTGANDDIRLIAGSNVTFTPNTGTNTLTIAASGGTDTTYTLPLTAQAGTSGDNAHATWTLTPSSGTANSVKLNAGSNVSITSLDTTGPDYEFTLEVENGAGLSLGSNLTDVFDLNSGTLSADDAGADRIIFWDDSPGKLTHLTVGAGLQISGTTLSATGSGSGITYDLLGGGSDGASFGQGTGKVILRPSTGSDDEVSILAGNNIKINATSSSGFTISADDVASTAFKLKNSGGGGNSAAIFELYPNGGSGASDQKIQITPGTGIEFTNTTQGLIIQASTTAGGRGYDLGTLLSPGMKLTGSDGTVDSVFFDATGGISISAAANSQNGGTITFDGSGAGITYQLKCTRDADGGSTGTEYDPYLFLDAATGTDDSVRIVGGTNVEVQRNNDSQLTISFDTTGFALDKIIEGNTSVECIDSGSNGKIDITVEGSNLAQFNTDYQLLLKEHPTDSREGGHLHFENQLGQVDYGIDVYSDDGTQGDAVIRVIDEVTRTGSTGTQRFCVNRNGALGIGHITASYGSAGQVLTSQGSGSQPTWSAASGSSSPIVCSGHIDGCGGFLPAGPTNSQTSAGTMDRGYNINSHSGKFSNNDGYGDYDGGITVNLTTAVGHSDYAVVASGYQPTSNTTQQTHPYRGRGIQGWRVYATSITSSSFVLSSMMLSSDIDDGGGVTVYPDKVSFIGSDPDGI